MKKVAIVTGSGSGIGAATAVELSKRGWSVVVNYSKSKEKAEEITKLCPDSLLVQADVGDDAECRKLVRAALDKWGRIDALVNNAGTTKFVKHPDLDGLSADDFLASTGSTWSGRSRWCAPAPGPENAKGAVVNVSSVAGLLGTAPRWPTRPRGGAQFAHLSLARARPEVRVNAVCPGYVDTPWQHSALGDAGAAQAAQRYSGMVPLKDYARPEDVADAIVWLIEGARQVTGETLFIDGGMHISTPR
jgi:3-oxoacyl-[acyl-carrier protein] reductase